MENRDYILNLLETKSINSPNGCRNWIGTVNDIGYGVMFLPGRKSTSAHRGVYQAFYNVKLPRNMVVCHSCDNRLCVNPDHLWEGTHRDNTLDMIKKKRYSKTRVLHSRKRKLTDDIVRAIKNDHDHISVVAQRYGISIGYVSKLRNNRAKTLIS